MVINGTNADENLKGGDEDDTIYAHGGDDYLFGYGGNDTLDGGAGADHMTGGSGDDNYYVDNRGDLAIEQGGIRGGKDTVWAWISFTLPDNVEILRLNMNAGAINGQGNSLDNEIYGNASNNHLWGQGGDDNMIGGGGADTMYGGTGDDYYSVENAGDVCIEYAGEGYDYVASSVSYTLGANLEYLKLFEGGAVDVGGNDLNNILVGNSNDNLITGADGHDWLVGGVGADLMIGGTGDDSYDVDNDSDIVFEGFDKGTDKVEASISFTLGANLERLVLKDAGGAINGTGNELDNYIWGNASFNVINGGDGDDVIDGGGGADTLAGGLDDDIYMVDDAGDTVIEADGEGIDVVQTSVNYTLGANLEWLTTIASSTSDLYLTGNTLNNQIVGNAGDNSINGGSGADFMVGYGGNDSYTVDHASDVSVEAASDGDDIVCAHVDYVLSANIEELSLNVGTAISGIGNGQDNVLYGNALGNYLNGGDGADQLSGLGGNDTFVFQAGQAQGDSVFEFDGNGAAAGDVLWFTGYGTLAGGAALVQLTATDWQVTSADGLTQETITLVGAPTIDASDFVFV